MAEHMGWLLKVVNQCDAFIKWGAFIEWDTKVSSLLYWRLCGMTMVAALRFGAEPKLRHRTI